MIQYFLFIICLLILTFLIYYVIDRNKHYEWFIKLKPGDKVLVTIYSVFCECKREATVVNVPNGKYVDVRIDDNVLKSCEECAKIKSPLDDGRLTCWYNVTNFHMDSVDNIKNVVERD